MPTLFYKDLKLIDYEKLKIDHELIIEVSEKFKRNAYFSMNYNLPAADWCCYDLEMHGIRKHFCDIDYFIEFLNTVLKLEKYEYDEAILQ